MTGDDLKKFRERRGLDRAELADLLNGALGRKYDAESVARWERGDRNMSRPVAAFVEELQLSTGLTGGPLDLDDPTGAGAIPSTVADAPDGDTAPGPGPSPQTLDPQSPFGSNAYTKACTELWEMIAAGVGMVGAATNSPALMRDGEILAADKDALGAAWGRLAETNDTFKRMLVGMTEGGAWLQVALVTGTTASKCWQSHVAYGLYAAEQQAFAGQPAPESPNGVASDGYDPTVHV